VVLHGEWAGGGTVISARPAVTLTDTNEVRTALSDQRGRPAVSSVVGGGWFGWLSYPGSSSWRRSDDEVTVGDHLGFYPSVLRYRRDDGCWYDEALLGIVSESALDARRHDLAALVRRAGSSPGQGHRVGPLRPRETRAWYMASVSACIERIRAGDVYQANLCFRMDADFEGDVTSLFADLVDALQPAYGALICTRSHAIVSVSPELFLRRDGDTVTSAPIKGTRPKSTAGRDPDPAAIELLRSAKERAENVMIVDLVRNDLGRVAATGTVRVPSLLAVEEHCGVWHLVSRVSATLAANCADGDLLAATFPAASVTGAPKQAARGVIAQLERRPRGLYTGAIGYLSPHAGLELNVAIRTAVISYRHPMPHLLSLGVGAGITAGSVPAEEWQECLNKAAPLVEAWSRDEPRPAAGSGAGVWSSDLTFGRSAPGLSHAVPGSSHPPDRGRNDSMALDTLVVFAASYENQDDAIADYEAVHEYYKSAGLIDTYDAAVITREDDGKVKVVKKHEQPTRQGGWAGLGVGLVGGALVALFPAIALAGGLLVGGAAGAGLGALAGHVAGGMSRSDLKDLGELLDEGQSGLVVVAATDMEAHVEAELKRAAKVTKKQLRADEKQLEKEIDAATA
jgi:anthranilate/para-aminobenzoate synthase component I/uncharacterized membrane protein